MFKLNNIKPAFGSKSGPKRKGKGIGSGLGKTAGKGHKGQRARSGHGVGAWFEGGQIPLVRRSPKLGFVSALKANRVEVNITELSKYEGKALKLRDLAPKSYRGKSRLFVALTGTKAPKSFPTSVEVNKISPAAKAIVEKAGVKVTVIPYTNMGVFSTRKSKG